MSSVAQMLANRINAQKSTGPRTPEGKATVAQNAVKHGLLAQRAVIRGEDPAEFELYRDQMLGDLAPAGAVEVMLAERVVSMSWRLRRAEWLQNEVFESLYLEEATSEIGKMVRNEMARSPYAAPGVSPGDLIIGRGVAVDFTSCKVMDRMALYERRIETSLFKTMAELREQRRLRGTASGAEPSCQTKPIGAGMGYRGARLSELTRLDTQSLTPEVPCETKPMAVSSGKGEVSNEQSQLAGLSTANGTLPTAAGVCETKPIDARGGAEQVPCGTTCETKPISDKEN
jgi:hypothetical protein